jgi:hypothetical protein
VHPAIFHQKPGAGKPGLKSLGGVTAMLKYVLASVVMAGLAASVPPGVAATNSKLAEDATPKTVSPQQQKMQDCAAKWKEEKTNSGTKGRVAYNKFMSACLKKGTT